jgi:hypothetical protein
MTLTKDRIQNDITLVIYFPNGTIIGMSFCTHRFPERLISNITLQRNAARPMGLREPVR